jgi:hypothetical protein
MNAYAPTEELDDVDKDRFYQTMERVYDSIPNYDIKMVIGDLNGKLGREDVYKGVIGKHSLHLKTNNNGQRVTDFAISKSMIIASTRFPHKEIHKITWTSPDGNT